MPKVAILIGSRSDEEVMQECAGYLQKFGIDHTMKVSSAHRQPEETAAFV